MRDIDFLSKFQFFVQKWIKPAVPYVGWGKKWNIDIGKEKNEILTEIFRKIARPGYHAFFGRYRCYHTTFWCLGGIWDRNRPKNIFSMTPPQKHHFLCRGWNSEIWHEKLKKHDLFQKSFKSHIKIKFWARIRTLRKIPI